MPRILSQVIRILRAMSHVDAEAQAIAARQGWVISVEQVHRLGFSRNQVGYRLRTGRWTVESRFGYRLAPPRDHLDRVRAAVALLPGAVASHQTAAELHQFPQAQRGLAVVTVHSRTTHDFPGVRVRRCHDLADGHVTEVEGIPVTTPARTVADLAGVLRGRAFTAMADRLLLERRVQLAELVKVVEAVARRGRPGSAVLRRLVAEHSQEGPSVLERRGRALLADGGLPAPVPEYPIPWAPRRRFDDAYPDHRLAIEWDSVRWHDHGDGFEIDRQRDRECVLHHWRLLRFTWRDVDDRPDHVVETVRRALEM